MSAFRKNSKIGPHVSADLRGDWGVCPTNKLCICSTNALLATL